MVALTPALIGVDGPIGTWDLPAEAVLTLLDQEIEEAPGVVMVTLTVAPQGEVVFSIAGEDVWTDEVDETGTLGPLSIAVPEGLAAGPHDVVATMGAVTATDVLTILHDPSTLPEPSVPDADPVVVEDSTGRWVLQDLRPGGLGSWIMPIGPASAEPIPNTKTLQANQTTYALGKIHVSEGRTLAAEWSFAGYCPNRAYYDKLTAYGALNRRCYVHTSRGRIFQVAFLGPDLVPRKRQRDDDGTWNDWAHDYTMRCLLFEEVTP